MTGSERWAALEIRLLIAFVGVIDAGSFTGAARQLGYTQSGISQQIASLERIIDRKLLVRQSGGRRPIELTVAGQALLEHSRTLLTQFDRAYGEVVDQEQNLAATVRITTFSSAAVLLVPPLQRAVRTETSLRLELLEGLTDDDIFSKLDFREAELGIAVLPVPQRFAVEEVGVDPYVAVVPCKSRLAERAELPLSQLAGSPLLGIRRSQHEDTVEARLSAAGVDCRAFTRCEDNRLIQAHVAAGNGIAIVPALTVEPADNDVRILPLHQANIPPRVIALVHLRDGLLSPAAREFRQLALPVCRQLLNTSQAIWAHAAAS